MVKKEFFRIRTEAEIRDLHRINCERKELVDQILGLGGGDYLVIPQAIIPDGFQTPNKFKKHGDEVKLKRFNSQEEMIQRRLLPVHLRSYAFDKIHESYKKTGKGGFFSGYTFRPVGVDEIPRKVSLVNCLQGAQIFAYANQIPGVEIVLKDYDDSRAVSEEGGRFVFNVPSRTGKHSRWKVGLTNVAVIDNDMKYVIANTIDSDHTCDEKRYNREMRFKFGKDQKNKSQRERSQVVQFCPHDITSYLKLTDTYWTENKNIVPLMASPFALPTQFSVDFYKKLLNNVLLMKLDKNGNIYEKSLNQAEQETLLWGLVMNYGHDKTFFAREKLKDYDWEMEGK